MDDGDPFCGAIRNLEANEAFFFSFEFVDKTSTDVFRADFPSFELTRAELKRAELSRAPELNRVKNEPEVGP